MLLTVEGARSMSQKVAKTTRTMEGGCECGNVRWRLEQGTSIGPVEICHCGQCNRMTSHVVAAVAVADPGLSWVKTETLNWYASSDFAKRGFCGNCGSQLAWRMNDPEERTSTSLMVGSFDDKSELRAARHIFVAHKAPYYDITDDLPQHAEWDENDVPI